MSEDADIDATWINVVCDAAKSYITGVRKGASVCEEPETPSKSNSRISFSPEDVSVASELSCEYVK